VPGRPKNHHQQFQFHERGLHDARVGSCNKTSPVKLPSWSVEKSPVGGEVNPGDIGLTRHQRCGRCMQYPRRRGLGRRGLGRRRLGRRRLGRRRLGRRRLGRRRQGRQRLGRRHLGRRRRRVRRRAPRRVRRRCVSRRPGRELAVRARRAGAAKAPAMQLMHAARPVAAPVSGYASTQTLTPPITQSMTPVSTQTKAPPSRRRRCRRARRRRRRRRAVAPAVDVEAVAHVENLPSAHVVQEQPRHQRCS